MQYPFYRYVKGVPNSSKSLRKSYLYCGRVKVYKVFSPPPPPLGCAIRAYIVNLER